MSRTRTTKLPVKKSKHPFTSPDAGGLILLGDALDRLQQLADSSVHQILTSPPFYGKRDYQTATWMGGDPQCQHRLRKNARASAHSSRLSGGKRVTGHQLEGPTVTCPHCGARRVDKQIGVEESPEEFIERLVAVFHEARRVLRPDGLCIINIGDSYWSGKGQSGNVWKPERDEQRATLAKAYQHGKGRPGEKRPTDGKHPTIKPKDLALIPFRLALALQADGWWVRSVAPWVKPNGLPESVTDRPTLAHEYFLILAKSRKYYWDAEAVKVPYATLDKNNPNRPTSGGRQFRTSDIWRASVEALLAALTGGPLIDPATGEILALYVTTKPNGLEHFATFPPDLIAPFILGGTSPYVCATCGAPWRRMKVKTRATPQPQPQVETIESTCACGQVNPGELCPGCGRRRSRRGRRNNLSSPPAPNQSAAAFGTPVETTGWEPTCGCGADGGQPDDWHLVLSPVGAGGGRSDPTKHTGRGGWNRVRQPDEGRRLMTRFEQRAYAAQLKASPQHQLMRIQAGAAFAHYERTDDSGARAIPASLLEAWLAAGWLTRVTLPERRPPEPVGAVVLDPFFGAGTTGLVCRDLGRRFVGTELNPAYGHMAQARIKTPAPRKKKRLTTRL